MQNKNTPPKETDAAKQKTEAALDGATCSTSSERTETASRWVWWIANMAMNQPYPRKKPKVGDTVIEVTHIMGLARVRLGRHSAIGELLEIDASGGEWNERYLIRSADPAEGDNWWGNARIEVIESNSRVSIAPLPENP